MLRTISTRTRAVSKGPAARGRADHRSTRARTLFASGTCKVPVKAFLAEQIVDLARRHNIPIVQRIPIAQALYKSVKVGEQIPHAMYVAVSEVIAYVFQLRGEKA